MATKLSVEKSHWFIINFSGLGFIGKLFKNTSLPFIIQFFLAFYNEKPCDWLLTGMVIIK